jgi:NADH-quinone oxidoreductase subunit A
MLLLEISNIYAFLIYGAAALFVVAFMIIFSHYIGEHHKAKRRDEAFESGMPPTGDARIRYPARFYMVAMFFVIFDLDVAFVVTYAIAYKELGWPGYAGICVFIFLLAAVLVYEWKTGALDFGPNGKKILKLMRERAGNKNINN